jgi:hypothetical protein
LLGCFLFAGAFLDGRNGGGGLFIALCVRRLQGVYLGAAQFYVILGAVASLITCFFSSAVRRNVIRWVFRGFGIGRLSAQWLTLSSTLVRLNVSHLWISVEFFSLTKSLEKSCHLSDN